MRCTAGVSRVWVSILQGDLREMADKSAVAAINRALRLTRKDGEPRVFSLLSFFLKGGAVFFKEEPMFSSRLFTFPRPFFGILLLISMTMTACGTTFQTTSGSSGPVQVVAAENFWGSITAQIDGSHVHVTSIIVDPNADPHSYEPTAADARTVAQAQYVIVNGAGYDPWADKLLQANPASGRKELNVGNFNGKHEGDNPHMWYNPDYVTAVVNKVRDDLKALDPGDASVFDQSAQTFLTTGLKQYHDLIAAIKAK